MGYTVCIIAIIYLAEYCLAQDQNYWTPSENQSLQQWGIDYSLLFKRCLLFMLQFISFYVQINIREYVNYMLKMLTNLYCSVSDQSWLTCD